jgi:hypothetical protein
MTTYQTAEIRRWRREKNYITGYVYNDPNDIWEDGEFFDIDLDDQPATLLDQGRFLLLVTRATVFKLDKDEQQK